MARRRAACLGRMVRPACVKGQPASDTGDPGFPFGPGAAGVQTIAYVQDIKPIFDRDCASCHGVRESAATIR